MGKQSQDVDAGRAARVGAGAEGQAGMSDGQASGVILSHSPTKQEREAGLEAKLRELHGSLHNFPLLLAHGIPDYVLLQFGHDVWEQAGATLLVARGPSPRAGVANARAAFEAALDMYALTAEPSLYDEMGASARVCELLAQEDLRQHKAKASDVVGFSMATTESVSPEEAVTSEARNWEVYQKGITVTYQRVLRQAREDGRWKYHWSGKGSYAEVAEYVQLKHGADPGFKEIAVLWYRALTHESHPGPRTSSRPVGHNEPGRLTVGPKDGDEAFPLLMATVACEHAIDAMRLRRELIRS